MIKLDISVALFLYLFFTIIVVFILWMWMNRGAGFSASKLTERNVWQCSVCHYVYIDTKNADFSRCPRCMSINQKGVHKA